MLPQPADPPDWLAGLSPTSRSVTFPIILSSGMKALSPGNAMATAPTLTTALPSAQEWKDMLEEILPPQGRWSEDEYLVLTDHRNRLVEFTDGFLEILPMPTDKHQAILGFLYQAFLRLRRTLEVGKSAFRRCGYEFGRASSVSPIFCCCFPPPIRAGRTVSGWAPTSPWKW